MHENCLCGALGALVDVGLGKTATWRQRIAPGLVKEGLTGVLAVPRHRLGDEVVRDLAADGVTGRVYRGREADDPERPGAKMCQELEGAKLIEDALGDVGTHACQHGDYTCRFFAICGYQRQRRQRPDLWIIPHQLLFRPRPDFIPKPASVAIDESFWAAALHGVDKPRKIWLRDLAEVREIATFGIGKIFRDEANTADLMDISMRVYRALALEPDGPVRRAALIEAGITVDDLRLAYTLEWRRKQDLQVHPGMPLAKVRSAVARVTTINKGVGDLARFWKLLANTIETDADRSPWLSIRQRTPSGESGECAPAVYMAWRDEVHESWTAPSLIMDATMSPEIVAVFFPSAEIASPIAAPMPHARVRQIVDRAMTADMLIPVGNPDEHPNPTRRANVERVRRFISFRATNVRPGRVLVVCQQGLEAALLDGPLPETVEIAHFNAITGLNAWKDVAVVIVIGRTEPAVREVERIATVLFGAPVREVEPDDEGHVRYPRTRRGIRMRDGRGIPVEGPEHPDARVEAVRWSICEGELIQAIGRGRGVNRTVADPLEIDILTNVCLRIEVEEVTTWKDIQPDVIDSMWAAGAIPGGYGDMAEAYPDLFPSRDAAKMAIRRTNQEQTSIEDLLYRRMFRVSVLGYRRKGSRGPAGKIFYDADRIDPRVWLTARFGDCTLLPARAVVEQTKYPAAVPIPGLPVFECDDDLEERLAIMTIDGGMTEAEARAALGLPLVLPSFYAIVDEVTDVTYPGPEDWLLATSVWIERCRSLQW